MISQDGTCPDRKPATSPRLEAPSQSPETQTGNLRSIGPILFRSVGLTNRKCRANSGISRCRRPFPAVGWRFALAETVLSCCKQACSCRLKRWRPAKPGRFPSVFNSGLPRYDRRAPGVQIAAAVITATLTSPRAAWQAGFPRLTQSDDTLEALPALVRSLPLESA